jgi:hypothetical protein
MKFKFPESIKKVFFVVVELWSAEALVMKLDFTGKPTILKFHPPICRITAHYTMPDWF